MPDDIVAILVVAAIAVLLVVKAWFASPGRTIERWLRQIQAGERPDSPSEPDFDFELLQTNEGFEIWPLKGQKGDVPRVVWERVTEASAYKRDLLSTDQICIAFTLDDNTFVEIHEEMKGFADLCENLPVTLPGALPFGRWYSDITVPAFGLCLTKLFTRHTVLSPG
jgi:hypothetical protein